MRVSKKHDVRLNEIMDAAEYLFITKGYEQTTVNDILARVEIGKGTFYHYFKSKEEVMNAVIERMVSALTTAARTIANDETLNAHQKLAQIIFSLNVSESGNGKMIEELHEPSNAQMHQKSIAETILAVSPILTDVIRQGINERVYITPYPKESIEFLLAANQFIFDNGIFHWTPEEITSKAKAFVHIIELVLGASEGSFEFVLQLLSQSAEGDGNDEK